MVENTSTKKEANNKCMFKTMVKVVIAC
jgi:hypothetical protein